MYEYVGCHNIMRYCYYCNTMTNKKYIPIVYYNTLLIIT